MPRPLLLVLTGLFTFLYSCSPKSDITYRPYSFEPLEFSNEHLKSIQSQWQSISIPHPREILRYDSGWNLSVGDPGEGLTPANSKTGNTPVTLPHRLLSPDTPLWYTQELTFNAAGVLAIRSDDGTQLFINHKRVPRLYNNYFPIDSAGTFQVTIRVLNNAMEGGLNRVTFVDQPSFRDYQEQRDHHIRLKRVVEKVLALNNSSDEQFAGVLKAVHEKDPGSLIHAEHVLNEFPYLVGPWLRRLDAQSMEVNILADSLHPVSLLYGTAENTLPEQQYKQGKQLSFTLSNLEIGETYYYKFVSGKTTTQTYRFTVQEPERFNFQVWADSQSGWSVFEQLVKNSLSARDAFGIAAGDLVSDGSNAEEWRTFFSILSHASSAPYYLVAGNHDYDGYYDDLVPSLYRELIHNHPPNYFSWTYANCAFIALDPNETFPIGFRDSSDQYKWFHQTLSGQAWKNADWHFIILHQPPYSQGWEGYHGDAVVRELIEPVIESAGIDFVVAGHTHNYERLIKTYGKQQVTYLVVGGAGGALEPEESSAYPTMDTVVKAHHIGRFYVNGKRIRFEAVNLNNRKIDSFSQSK